MTLTDNLAALRFWQARYWRDDGVLARYSMPEALMQAQFAGRSIALIGNARALADGAFGAQIDQADRVIRINRAPIPAQRSHGARTDALALATSIPRDLFDARAPALTLWMSHKTKRLPLWLARHDGFYLHPLAHWQDLRDRLGAPPTTGLMMIDLLARTQMTRLSLYGFDFFASQSLTGHRRADQVPHDFPAERAFVEALAARDERVFVQQG